MASGVRATVALTTRSRKGPHVSCPHDKSRCHCTGSLIATPQSAAAAAGIGAVPIQRSGDTPAPLAAA
jgi:hypothetical protein